MEIHNIEELQKLIAAKKMVFVEMYTVWCGPCKLLAARIDVEVLPLLKSHPDIEFAKLNVELSPDVLKWAESVGMEVVPSIAVFVDGTQILVSYLNQWRNIMITNVPIIRGNQENIQEIVKAIVKKKLNIDL